MELTTKLTKIKNKTKGLEPLFLYNTDLNLNSFLLTHLRHKAIKDKIKMLININMYNIHNFNTPFLDSCFIGCKNHKKPVRNLIATISAFLHVCPIILLEPSQPTNVNITIIL